MKRVETSLTNDFINARVRGMRSKLLEAERLSALTESRSLPELIRRITPAATFAGHREFQRDLMARAVRELDRLGNYLPGRMRDVFDWLLTRYALENLKAVLRAYKAGEPAATAESLLTPVPRALALPVEKLFQAPDLLHFVDAVPMAEFRAPLAELLKTREHVDLFSIESTLDHAYFSKLRDHLRDIDGCAKRLMAFDLDARSVMLVLRAKYYYGGQFEAIEPFLVPSGVNLHLDNLRQLWEARDLAEAIGRIPTPMLPAELRPSPPSLVRLGDALDLQQYRLAAHCFAELVLEPSLVIAYFYIKHIELSNLFRLTEGVRHSLPREELEARLLKP